MSFSNLVPSQHVTGKMAKARQQITTLLGSLVLTLGLASWSRSNTRTLESPFALSSDARSEFRTEFRVPSPGRLVLEATWNVSGGKRSAASLSFAIIRPDGTIAEAGSGASPLRLEHVVTDQELRAFSSAREAKWTVKILNNVDASRSEVAGNLRITVPASGSTLEDTQFTLLGSGNAQEIPIRVPEVGRLEVIVTWEPEAPAKTTEPTLLVVSLIHPGEARTYARRQGASPLAIDQQVTDAALDRGGQWNVRVENNSQKKVKGTVKVTYVPSL